MPQLKLIDFQEKSAEENTLLAYYEDRTADLVEECQELIKEEMELFFALHHKTIPLFSQMIISRQIHGLKEDFCRYLLVTEELEVFLNRLLKRLEKEISRYFQRSVDLVYRQESLERLPACLLNLEQRVSFYMRNLKVISYFEVNLNQCSKNVLDSFKLTKLIMKILDQGSWGERIFALGEVSQKRYQSQLNNSIKGILDSIQYELIYDLSKEITQAIYSLQDETVDYLTGAVS